MRIVPNDDDDSDDRNAYTDVRHLHLEPLIDGRCHCAACRHEHDPNLRDGRTLPRQLQRLRITRERTP